MSQDGGSPVRQREILGKRQFWVVTNDARVIASESLRNLALELGAGVPAEVREVAKTKKDAISVAEAARITGYSRSLVNKCAASGEIEVLGRKGTHYRISRASALAWAAKQRAKGASHCPRPRGVKQQRGKRERKVNGPVSPLEPRLQRYLRRLQGTPFEITKEQFTQRALKWALDRLES